jgi:hypothetical protein
MSDSSKTETPAETMRRAAALMRERAEAAPGGPWRAKAGHLDGSPHYVNDADGHTAAECWGGSEEATSAHIASWSPPIAEAVADLLGEIARQYDAPPCDSPDGACNGCEWREDFTDALRLASAYLAAETNMTGGAA